MVALPCVAGPSIVALPDGRQFGADGDVAYVIGMPLDATVGSRWQGYAPSAADPRDRRGGEVLPRLPPDVPAQNLVELVSGSVGLGGIAVVNIVSSVRELMPGSVLVPLPAGRSEAEPIAEVE
ncbi:hypothetical protein [Cupriavidus cauae]|uniref:Uncharacterized protein n=1 Tax=Cupriavidus cauae TaxID=2608999 RepID=A0A5M8AQS7_9BURK|nr:hypothetical protein [Cupriavidus cauae]KAA6124511.1 hypothetical protein F1599_11415 [Cupriavidus cauae]